MTDQRLGGFSHAELYQMAHGGNPESPASAHAHLTRAAHALEAIGETLQRPLNELGLGWQGRAADAAKVGLGQHVAWPGASAVNTEMTGGRAYEQSMSARNVIAQMPPPPVISAAEGAKGAPGGGPAGMDWARVEQAQENARQRAIELMQGHAAQSRATRPTGAFAQPPTAGAAAASPGARTGRGPAGRGTPGRAPGINPSGAAAGSGAGTARTGTASGGSPMPTRGGAAVGVGPTGGSGGRGTSAGGGRASGGLPAAARSGGGTVRGGGSAVPITPSGASRPGATRRGSYRPHTSEPTGGRTTSGRTAGGPAERGPARGAPAGGPAERYSRVGGSEQLSAREGPAVTEPSGRSAHGAGPESAGAHQQSGAGGPVGPGGVPPPMMGGAGIGGSDHKHHRLGYLVEDDDIFGPDDEWVAPPVIAP